MGQQYAQRRAGVAPHPDHEIRRSTAKKFSDLRLRTKYGITITRVNRAGVDLIPYQGLELQVGDRVMVVGPAKAVAQVADVLGNSLKKLNQPNLVTIFVGIALGVLLGSIPLLNVPSP